MTAADRFADPLAAAWRDHRTELPARVLALPARVLASPYDDGGDLDPDQATSPPHIHPLVAGRPANPSAPGKKLTPHQAFPGGPP
ncbi:hypothetical protein [Micromonospora sp. NBC_00421]|uniref:hypothetical protein n=1 Tax=Micromonospora sp. NBC_00421 TaxID=2975976 RepID=UPI002E1DB971